MSRRVGTCGEIVEHPIHDIAQHDQGVTPAVKAAAAAAAAAAVVDASARQGAGAQNDAHLPVPTTHTRTVVAQVWDEVGLVLADSDGQEKEDLSMFACGGDLVTTMLLSRCYQRRGYGLSMQDCVDRPTRASQSRLLASKGG